MVPIEIADLMQLIYPAWAELEGDDFREVLNAARRIHEAGYRKQPAETTG